MKTCLVVDDSGVVRKIARRILEAMTDQQFVAWSNKLITTIACYYIAYGGWLLVRTPVLAAFTKGGLQ